MFYRLIQNQSRIRVVLGIILSPKLPEVAIICRRRLLPQFLHDHCKYSVAHVLAHERRVELEWAITTLILWKQINARNERHVKSHTIHPSKNDVLSVDSPRFLRIFTHNMHVPNDNVQVRRARGFGRGVLYEQLASGAVLRRASAAK